jgi:hypothetical protein
MMADDPPIDEEWRAALLLWAMVRDEDDRSRMLRTAVVVQGLLAPDLSFRELLRRAVAKRRETLGWVA